MTIEIVIGLIGLCIAIATFVQSQKPQEVKFIEPNEEMEELKISFKMNQKISLEIQDLLKKHIEGNKCPDELFFQKMTFTKYLQFLKDNYNECLSDEVYERTLSRSIYTRPVIASMSNSLQNQFQNLMLVKNYIKALV
ncbi:hypothetical protein SAMN06265349_104309 [Flavobacterium resistens]|uniref:Uncharacterized protein n=1 Tax=Flavobacterium resistens TaxID=443612 RepID=A0A521ED18_9FLAO|nr:hypothetical protein [Flavobacterium resistens]MRX69009.1 hypothetical protein [Flavobacterium resistens]SMO81080.1 hypothetical protein SAMN06265349_104309 [Flavobacterium resistens]